jgi:hypothetical protein
MQADGSATLTQLWQGCAALVPGASRVALLVLAAPALGEVRTLAEVHTPDRGDRTAFPVIDAFGGRVAWSDYDATINGWRLMEHAAGVTRALPVEPRRSPFDVDLGPDGRGGTIAVYSRCARGLRLDLPTPQPLRAARHGCDLYSFSFTTGRETAIERLNSRADEYWPSVWGSRIAFVRGYAGRRDPDRTSTPYLYLGNRRLRRPSSVLEVRMDDRTERVRLSTTIEGLDLRGRTLAYAWSRTDETDTDSYIYLAPAGGALRPAARGATSGGGASIHVRTVSLPSIGADGAHWLLTNSGEPAYFGAFARRGPRGVAAHEGGGLRPRRRRRLLRRRRPGSRVQPGLPARRRLRAEGRRRRCLPPDAAQLAAGAPAALSGA